MNLLEYIQYAATGESYKAWFIVFGLGLGVILSSIVLMMGLIKKKQKLAIIGTLLTFLGNASIGFILGAPIAIVFIWLILKPKKDKLLDAEEEDELLDVELDENDK